MRLFICRVYAVGSIPISLVKRLLFLRKYACFHQYISAVRYFFKFISLPYCKAQLIQYLSIQAH